MCHLWFNTFFLESNVLTLEKHEVDKAHKDKKDKVFSRDFRVELRFVDVLSKKQAPDSSVYAEAHDQREATGTTVANNAGTQTAALDESPTTSTAPPLADRMAAISSSGRAMGFVLPPDFNSMLTERVAAAAKATAAFEARRNGSAGEMAAESANSTENNAASSNANATASTAAHAPASSNADDIDMRPLTVTVAEEMDIVSESEDDTESEDEDDDDDGDDKEEEEGDDGFRSAK